MQPERWRQVEEIFQTALDLEPDERVRYITRACTGDAELEREVQALLTQYESAGDFLDTPVEEAFAPIVALVLGQLLAIELALVRGLDPAHPRGLSKFTSTR